MSYLLELARLHIALTQILTQNTNYTVYMYIVCALAFNICYLLKKTEERTTCSCYFRLRYYFV